MNESEIFNLLRECRNAINCGQQQQDSYGVSYTQTFGQAFLDRINKALGDYDNPHNAGKSSHA